MQIRHSFQKVRKRFDFAKAAQFQSLSEALVPANRGHSFRFGRHKFFLEAHAQRFTVVS
jgi:hypothetical protein